MHYEINTQLSTVHQEYFQCSVSYEEDVYRLFKKILIERVNRDCTSAMLWGTYVLCVSNLPDSACCRASPEESDNVVPNNQI